MAYAAVTQLTLVRRPWPSAVVCAQFQRLKVLECSKVESGGRSEQAIRGILVAAHTSLTRLVIIGKQSTDRLTRLMTGMPPCPSSLTSVALPRVHKPYLSHQQSKGLQVLWCDWLRPVWSNLTELTCTWQLLRSPPPSGRDLPTTSLLVSLPQLQRLHLYANYLFVECMQCVARDAAPCLASLRVDDGEGINYIILLGDLVRPLLAARHPTLHTLELCPDEENDFFAFRMTPNSMLLDLEHSDQVPTLEWLQWLPKLDHLQLQLFEPPLDVAMHVDSGALLEEGLRRLRPTVLSLAAARAEHMAVDALVSVQHLLLRPSKCRSLEWLTKLPPTITVHMSAGDAFRSAWRAKLKAKLECKVEVDTSKIQVESATLIDVMLWICRHMPNAAARAELDRLEAQSPPVRATLG
jgi:hypothetical protein